MSLQEMWYIRKDMSLNLMFGIIWFPEVILKVSALPMWFQVLREELIVLKQRNIFIISNKGIPVSSIMMENLKS